MKAAADGKLLKTIQATNNQFAITTYWLLNSECVGVLLGWYCSQIHKVSNKVASSREDFYITFKRYFKKHERTESSLKSK